MKKRIIIISIFLVLIVSFIFIKTNGSTNEFGYSQEYVVGKGNIKGEVDVNRFESKGKEFEIGANKYGYAVFKNPTKAFEKLKKDYKKGIELIQKEYNLRTLSQSNYEKYKHYGWQVTTGTNEEQEQARFITSFMDIYENSFKRN